MSAPAKIRLEAIERAGHTCEHCGHAGTYQDGCWVDLEVDHIIPESQGGPHSLDNLRVLCYPCHLKRHGCNDPKPYAKRLRGRTQKAMLKARLSTDALRILSTLSRSKGVPENVILEMAIRHYAERDEE